MSEPRGLHPRSIAQVWDRWAAVDAPDDETRRVGRLFSILMAVSCGLAIGLALIMIAAGARGLFGSPREMWVAAAFPLLFVPLSIGCLVGARRGHVRAMIRLYIWANYIGLVIACLVFGGYQSAAWFIFVWPIVLAGTLMRPADGLLFAGATIVVFVVIAGLQQAGIYRAPLTTSLESFRFIGLATGLLMLFIGGGLVTYFNASSLRGALARLRDSSRDLERIRLTLEVAVAERTAELQRRAQQFEAIAEIGRLGALQQESSALLQAAVRLVADRWLYQQVRVFLADPDGQWLVLSADSGEDGAQSLARGYRLQIGQQSIPGLAAFTGVQRTAFNSGDDAAWFAGANLVGLQAEAAFPLKAGDRVVGVLDVLSSEPSGFSSADMEVLSVLADSLAIALANTLSLVEMRATLERIERYEQRDAVRAWRQALARRNLRVGYEYVSGLVAPVETARTADADGSELLSRVVARPLDEGGYRLLAPVTVGGQQLGVLAFDRQSPWPAETIELVERVVAQLDLALNNARLLEETRLRATQEAARSDIVARIRALASTDAVMRSAAEEIGRALQVERSRIQLLPPGSTGAG